MNDVRLVIRGMFDILNTTITIYGYSFTIWQIIILFGIASVLVVLLVFCWGVIDLVFEFIQNPQSTVDLCYNLFLFDRFF